ncbi:MAG: TonB-dependent receptor domain-containing protein, partial [Chitinophagaceae bacterium]
GGFSTTSIRPELKDIAPFTSYDFRSLQVTQGNEELRSTTIKNFDVKFEYFPTAGEIVSFSAYYKNILDPIEKVTGFDNTPAVRPVNTGRAYVRGFEVEFRKKLDFIKKASWLSNVQVFGNGSLIQSKVKAGPVNNFFIRSVTEHPLSGQPNYLINAGLSILMFKKTFEATLSYNRSGDFINQLGTFDEILLANGKKSPLLPNLNVKGRELLDLVLTQSFMKEKGKIKFNISNILKAPFIIYQDLNGNKKFDEAATIEKTSNPTLAHGIFGGVDNTPSYIIPQRTFSIAISYNFSTSKR